MIGSLRISPSPDSPSLSHALRLARGPTRGRARPTETPSSPVPRWRKQPPRPFTAHLSSGGGREAVVLKQVSVRCEAAGNLPPSTVGLPGSTMSSCTSLVRSRSRSPAGCPPAAAMNKCPVQWSRYVKCANIRCFTVKCPLFGGQGDSTWTSRCVNTEIVLINAIVHACTVVTRVAWRTNLQRNCSDLFWIRTRWSGSAASVVQTTCRCVCVRVRVYLRLTVCSNTHFRVSLIGWVTQ